MLVRPFTTSGAIKHHCWIPPSPCLASLPGRAGSSASTKLPEIHRPRSMPGRFLTRVTCASEAGHRDWENTHSGLPIAWKGLISGPSW
jgi:hypothetical protein